MITASDVLAIIHNMGRDDISLDSKNLVTDGLLSSLEIFRLVEMLEDHFDLSIEVSLLSPESLSSCESIAQLLEQSAS